MDSVRDIQDRSVEAIAGRLVAQLSGLSIRQKLGVDQDLVDEQVLAELQQKIEATRNWAHFGCEQPEETRVGDGHKTVARRLGIKTKVSVADVANAIIARTLKKYFDGLDQFLDRELRQAWFRTWGRVKKAAMEKKLDIH